MNFGMFELGEVSFGMLHFTILFNSRKYFLDIMLDFRTVCNAY